MLEEGVLHVKLFMSITIGVTALLVGKRVNDSYNFLKDYSIPNPVTGGLIFAVLSLLVYLVFKVEINFDLTARDVLLVYFFTTIGINASIKDLKAGGKSLVILLLITIGFIFVQNFTGIAIASLFKLPSPLGILSGSISLIGGHGTAIAWAPHIETDFGIHNAMEIGVTTATLGLILSSLIGGPVARYLIKRKSLESGGVGQYDVGITSREEEEKQIGHLEILNALLAIHICIIFGVLLDRGLALINFRMPLFVSCLLSGILISNAIPKSFPGFRKHEWPARKPAMAIIADISLGTFLAMSLMSMKLWTIAKLVGPVFSIVAVQFIIALIIIIFVVFRVMGSNYDAAVICAGFAGFSLGATPTAMANMAAVSQRYGPSHVAFVVVPMVCAFFIDLANAMIIPVFLRVFS